MQEEAVLQKRLDETLPYEDDDGEGLDALADKYLLFNIDRDVYGVDIRHIIEIIELQKITEVPDMPEYIKGVINLRGKIIPALDMRVRFRIDERGYDDRNCIVIVKVQEKLVGLVVDSVEEVLNIPKENIEPTPNFKTEEKRQKFISGLAKTGNGVQIILDVEKIASIQSLIQPETGEEEEAHEN